MTRSHTTILRHTGCAIVLLASVANIPAGHAEGQSCLTELERKIEADHRPVSSVLPHQFGAMLRDGAATLVLDVRERAEFDVSHVPGAIHVDPDMTADEFLAKFGDRIEGKSILLYCSVGVRSSRLAQRIDSKVREKGANGAFNLRGGIFAMHNYGLKLTEASQPTDWVHPYSRAWSRYLDFPNYARFSPPRR